MMWAYNNYYSGLTHNLGLFEIIIPFSIFDLILRGFALWRSAKKDQNIWFIVLLFVNSLGIIPIIYLILNQNQNTSVKKLSKTK